MRIYIYLVLGDFEYVVCDQLDVEGLKGNSMTSVPFDQSGTCCIAKASQQTLMEGQSRIAQAMHMQCRDPKLVERFGRRRIEAVFPR